MMKTVGEMRDPTGAGDEAQTLCLGSRLYSVTVAVTREHPAGSGDL